MCVCVRTRLNKAGGRACCLRSTDPGRGERGPVRGGGRRARDGGFVAPADLCFRRGAQCFTAGPRGSAWHFNAASVAFYTSVRTGVRPTALAETRSPANASTSSPTPVSVGHISVLHIAFGLLGVLPTPIPTHARHSPFALPLARVYTHAHVTITNSNILLTVPYNNQP